MSKKLRQFLWAPLVCYPELDQYHHRVQHYLTNRHPHSSAVKAGFLDWQEVLLMRSAMTRARSSRFSCVLPAVCYRRSHQRGSLCLLTELTAQPACFLQFSGLASVGHCSWLDGRSCGKSMKLASLLIRSSCTCNLLA